MPRFKTPPKPKKRARAPAIRGSAITRVLGAADSWLAARVDWLVWLIVLIGFYLRFDLAHGSYLNGDEAQIMLPPLQHGLGNVYRAALIMPYGPVGNFLLHFMTFLGRSELYFRMPSVLAGALLPYVAYRWAADTFGKGAGFATACILGFSPALVILSAQLRFYAIHMLWVVCSLYCLERAFRDQSAKWVRLFGAALLLGLLTMYMSVWYTAAIGLYALLRILKRQLPLRLVREWAGIQVAAACLLMAAYATHLRLLRGGESERLARDVWLRGSYYHSDAGNALSFLTRSTDALFGYIFANATLGTWMIFVFLLGAGLLLWRKAGVPGTSRTAVLSLVLPLTATYLAATLSLYPYGGSRHDAFLSVFVAAGIAAALSFLTQGRMLLLLPAAVFLVPQWRAAAQHHYLDEVPETVKVEYMRNALDYLATRTPRPRVLLVDQLGAATVNYYVCQGAIGDWRHLSSDLSAYSCAGYWIVPVQVWSAPPSAFPQVLVRAREVATDLLPDPAWVFYISPSQLTIDHVREQNRGLFGKIALYRIWSPDQSAARQSAGPNLALGKPTMQSSSLSSSTGPGKAVDGNTDGTSYHGSLTHTSLESNPWWQVDLSTSAALTSITIWNRTDCCIDRLSDYWIFVSETPFEASDTPAQLQNRPGTWSSHQTAAPDPSVTIAVPAVRGRFVRVQLSGANYLSLAEVQVSGR